MTMSTARQDGGNGQVIISERHSRRRFVCTISSISLNKTSICILSSTQSASVYSKSQQHFQLRNNEVHPLLPRRRRSPPLHHRRANNHHSTKLGVLRQLRLLPLGRLQPNQQRRLVQLRQRRLLLLRQRLPIRYRLLRLVQLRFRRILLLRQPRLFLRNPNERRGLERRRLGSFRQQWRYRKCHEQRIRALGYWRVDLSGMDQLVGRKGLSS